MGEGNQTFFFARWISALSLGMAMVGLPSALMEGVYTKEGFWPFFLPVLLATVLWHGTASARFLRKTSESGSSPRGTRYAFPDLGILVLLVVWFPFAAAVFLHVVGSAHDNVVQRIFWGLFFIPFIGVGLFLSILIPNALVSLCVHIVQETRRAPQTTPLDQRVGSVAAIAVAIAVLGATLSFNFGPKIQVAIGEHRIDVRLLSSAPGGLLGLIAFFVVRSRRGFSGVAGKTV